VIQAPGTLVALNAYDLPTVRRWHTDTMVLVGDAAHAASPAAGQGASMTIEDSVVLAKCLRDIPSFPEAFRTYERLRRPRVEQMVAMAAAQDPADQRERPQVARATNAWLHEHRLDWESPVIS